MATFTDTIVFSRDEIDLIVELAGCSLNEKPGSNYVEDNGGLPDYICRIAKAVKKTGKTTSQAIAIAISRVRVWASGKGVDKDTQAKATAALAEYEKLLAKTHAKTAAKKAGKVAASRPLASEILCLSESVTVFNVDSVRRAWDQQTNDWRRKFSQQNPYGNVSESVPYSYIREMWTDHLIVATGEGEALYRVEYTVDSDGNVTFGEPVAVRTQYVTIESGDMVGDQMSNSQLRQLMATVGPCHPSATEQILLSAAARVSNLDVVLSHQTGPKPLDLVLSHTVKAQRSALEQLLELHGGKR